MVPFLRDVHVVCLSLMIVTLTCDTIENDPTKEPGHLKPFGHGRWTVDVEETDVTPDPKTFWTNYVYSLRPLKMKGAAKISPAFNKWTDDYFLSLDMKNQGSVTVETQKKESRQQKVLQMDFHQFVKTYNHSEIYMVNSVPKAMWYIFSVSLLCYNCNIG